MASWAQGAETASLDGLNYDTARGERIFIASGCASCHAVAGEESSDHPVLSGGKSFETAFGTFYAPNITPDKVHGIGAWSLQDLSNALTKGKSPDATHYYPAFPYWSYARMQERDIADLYAYMMMLPADGTPNREHDVSFPFNLRFLVGFWKKINMRDDFVLSADNLTKQEIRGRYLAEALAHCGECHTPRNFMGGVKTSHWLSGGALPSGEGSVPAIDVQYLDWGEDEIVEYLTSGFTPEFDSVGGSMLHVVDNFAKLPEEDRQAVAAYLKKISN